MNVLICLLGLSPGVATGAFYALARDRDIPVDRLVTVGTSAGMADACEREIIEELKRWRDAPDVAGIAAPDYDYDLEDGRLKVLPPYTQGQDVRTYREHIRRDLWTDSYGQTRERPQCRIRLPYEDVSDRLSAAAFREVLLVLVREIYRNDRVYACVAGGRKSMAAIAMLAAQFGLGVRRLFHLHNYEDEAETHGSVEDRYWPTVYDERKARFLRPRSEKLELVDIPFLRITSGPGGPEVFLAEDDSGTLPEQFVLDFLNESKLKLDADSNERVVTAFFEERVVDYLREQDYEAWRSPSAAWLKNRGVHVPPAQDDPNKPSQIDVVGFKDSEVLLVECKLHLRKSRHAEATIKYDDAVQAAHLRNTRLGDPNRHLAVWLVSTATGAEEGVWRVRGVRLMSTDKAITERLREARWKGELHDLLEGSLRIEQLAPLVLPPDLPEVAGE